MRKERLKPGDSLDVLQALGKQSKGKISPINLYDGNVCTWTHPPGRPWEFTLVSGRPFSKQLRYVYRGSKVRMFANSRFINIGILGSFESQRMSINEKDANDPLLEVAEPLIVDGKQHSLFTKSSTKDSSHKVLLARTTFTELIRELDLQVHESLHFSADDISVYLDRPSLSRVTTAVEGLVSLSEEFKAPREKLDLDLLPRQFHALIPLINRWAIDDDSDRDDFLENLPKSALVAFVAEVEPYLLSIDSYLDSFGKRPPSESACALGRLAEAALEAKRLLMEKRS